MPRSWILAASLSLGCATSALAAGSTGIVVSQVRGQAVLMGGTAGAARQPVRPLQMIAPGTTLRLAEEAEVVVLCADDRALHLTGPMDWQAGPSACASGIRLAPGTHARLVPSPGRVVSFHGTLLQEPPSRGDDGTGKVPVLLGPHSPQRRAVLVAEARPALAWLEVSGALSYQLILEGAGARPAVRIEGDRADCKPDPRGNPAQVCTAAWPWPPLAPGQEVSLRVEAETSDPDWRVRKSDASRLRLADAGVRATTTRCLAALADSDLPTATRELLRATVYAEAGLFNETAEALAASLKERPEAAVAVRLADLYLGLGLLRPALNTYGRAEQLLPSSAGDDEIRAALFLGLGRLHARREDPGQAAEYLEKAARLFGRIGWSGEAAVATKEAALAKRGAS